MRSGIVVTCVWLQLALPTLSSDRELLTQDFFPLPEDLLTADESHSDCPLNCENGAVCVIGNQSLAGHVSHPLTGGPLNFHTELNRDGYSCSCPTGWTGLECELSYETCNDGEHICYNGGKCIPGLEDEYGNGQLYCDCDDAIDPDRPTIRFAGKYCEEDVDIVYEDCNNEDVCQNGGICKTEADPLNPCECPSGFEGKYCEYVDNTVPDCSKDCLNGGFCRLGVDDDALGKKDSEYCECPPAFYGDYCELNAELCGEEYCYHGSKCFEILLADGSTEHLCDCVKAYTDNRYFAGEFCQYPSTDFCTGSDDPNGRQFCTNGGLCPQERFKPCDCPPGFLGPRCAYQIGRDGEDYAECKLQCKNGGTCQKGWKDLTAAYGKFAGDVAHLLNETHENYEHCVCPDGFFGIRCEYEVEDCVESEHRCYHGSTCVDLGGEKGCDCESSDTPTAGLFCEFFATEDCSEYPNDFSDSHRGFCTNGGTCLIDDAGLLRCKCPQGYDGPHCEFKIVDPKEVTPHSSSSPSISQETKILCAWAICAVVMFTGLFLYRDHKFRLEKQQQSNEEMPKRQVVIRKRREEYSYPYPRRGDDDAIDPRIPKRTGAFSSVEIL